MSEFSACRFLITRFLYAGFYCIQNVPVSCERSLKDT